MNPLRGKSLAGLRFFVTLLSWCGIVISAARSLGQERSFPSIPIVDVALHADNSLHGKVVSADGQARHKTTIELRSMTGDIKSTKADGNGRFVFTRVTGGSYQLATPHGNYLCRVWTSRAAPPAAVSELLVVSDVRVARAQRPLSDMFINDPFWMGIAVAAAIVIPIAVYNSGGDRALGS